MNSVNPRFAEVPHARCTECSYQGSATGTLCPLCGAALAPFPSAPPPLSKLWCPFCWGLRGMLLYLLLLWGHGFPACPREHDSDFLENALDWPAAALFLVSRQPYVHGQAHREDGGFSREHQTWCRFSPWAFLGVGLAGYFLVFWLFGELMAALVCRGCRRPSPWPSSWPSLLRRKVFLGGGALLVCAVFPWLACRAPPPGDDPALKPDPDPAPETEAFPWAGPTPLPPLSEDESRPLARREADRYFLAAQHTAARAEQLSDSKQRLVGWQDAISLYNQAILHHGAEATYYLHRGKVTAHWWRDDGRRNDAWFVLAQENLSAALKIDPELEVAHWMKAELYREARNLPMAVKHYEDYHHGNPDSPSVRLRLGECYLDWYEATRESAQLDAADRHLSAVLSLVPPVDPRATERDRAAIEREQEDRLLSALGMMSRLRERQRRMEEALALALQWRVLLERHGDRRAVAEGYRRCANLRLQQGRHQQALADADRALELDADSAENHYTRAMILAAQIRLAGDDRERARRWALQARAAFNAALERDARYQAALINRGLLLWREFGEGKAARADLEAAQRLGASHEALDRTLREIAGS